MTPTLRYIPATEDLLRGWCGPVEYLDTFYDPDGRWTPAACGIGGMANGVDSGRIRLDTHRPEVIAPLARWLEDKGHSAAHILPTWLGGRLSTEVSGEALAWSVLSVRAGDGVLREIISVADARRMFLRGVAEESVAAAIAAGFALRGEDGVVTWPPLPGGSDA